MNKKISYALILSTAFLLLVSCARVQPVLNIQNQQVYHLTTNDVKRGIELGAADKRWQTKEVKPGLIFAWINVRSHYAAVNINYSANSYSITYVASRNLMAQNGKIHRNYNKWIKLLDKSIHRRLTDAKLKK